MTVHLKTSIIPNIFDESSILFSKREKCKLLSSWQNNKREENLKQTLFKFSSMHNTETEDGEIIIKYTRT